jgi:Ca-activated chloride channel family protein
MTFLWLDMLWLAALLPLLALAYVWLLRRRKKAVLRYSSVALVKQAMSGGNWRRHLPAALLLAALGVLILAGARPAMVLTLPSQQQIIMLVMDVSGSMGAEDVQPNRISASQAAAKAFAQELPRDVRIGVVAYGGTAQLVQPPTLHREDVIAAIDRFQLQRGTAIGSAILVAMDALFPDDHIDLPEAAMGRGPLSMPQRDSVPGGPVPPGSYESAAIILLTDGQNTVGMPPMDAAQIAASRGVKIFTVGFGTKEGATISFEGWSVRVMLDEETLKEIASLTHGEYFHAGSGTDLKKVYAALRSRLVLERKEIEMTALFAYLAGALTIVAAGLSVYWFGRVL